MINFRNRIISALLILAFIPMLMGVCCCIEDVFSSLFPSSHLQKDHHSDHASDQGDHGCGDCEHDSLIAVNPSSFTALDFKLVFASIFSQVQIVKAESLLYRNKKHSLFDTGPPGQSPFFNTPVFLQLSVLRI